MKNVFVLTTMLFATLCYAQFSNSKPVTNTADGVRWIDAGDIDGDGYIDIIAANRFGSNITWYKNTNDPNQPFISNQLPFLDQTSMVTVGDLDMDGDLDIIASSTPEQIIVWYENLNGLGNFSSRKIIETNTINAFFLLVEDIDADGDLDVMSGGDGSRIEWFENLDGLGNFGDAIVIDNSIPNCRSLAMGDLDNDGDLDLISVSSGSINIWWYENLNGFGLFSSKLEIGGNGSAANHTLLSDFDNDGFLDILVSYGALDRLVWHRNENGTGNFSTQKNISLSDKALGIKIADFNDDGYDDIISASVSGLNLKWYEYSQNTNNFNDPQTIEAEEVGTKCLAIDIDNDGDIDAIRASQNDDTIVWYENLTILNAEEFSIDKITIHPNPATTAIFVKGLRSEQVSLMQLTNIAGQQVWKTQKGVDKITIEQLHPGVYFLEIQNEQEQKKVFKIVKN